MNSVLVLVLSSVVGFSLSSLDVFKVCNDVRDADNLVTNKIQNPTISQRDQVFTDIRNYIKTLGPLQEALKIDKDRTLEVCKDVFQPGTSKFMNVPYDHDFLVSGFNWTNDDMNAYRDLRDDTLTEWVKMEPIIFA